MHGCLKHLRTSASSDSGSPLLGRFRLTKRVTNVWSSSGSAPLCDSGIINVVGSKVHFLFLLFLCQRIAEKFANEDPGKLRSQSRKGLLLMSQIVSRCVTKCVTFTFKCHDPSYGVGSD